MCRLKFIEKPKDYCPDEIVFSIHARAGRDVLVASEGGVVCFMGFCDGTESEARHILEAEFHGASLRESAPALHVAAVEAAFAPEGEGGELSVLLRGTEFQRTVWRALARIPFGSTMTYSELASNAGFPGAVRATGTAIGRNNVAPLLPCHRVVRASGATGHYRWGAEVKAALIKEEAEILGRCGVGKP